MWHTYPDEINKAVLAGARAAAAKFPNHHWGVKDFEQEAEIYAATHQRLILRGGGAFRFVRRHVYDRMVEAAGRSSLPEIPHDFTEDDPDA